MLIVSSDPMSTSERGRERVRARGSLLYELSGELAPVVKRGDHLVPFTLSTLNAKFRCYIGNMPEISARYERSEVVLILTT
jgi:hypothetical protein